ncbi:organic cation transporter protein-like isoform X2 [Tubulanus polymorphus]
MALGSLTLTFLADKLGRKPIFLISHLILAIASVIAAFSINYFMFAVMRMVQGISTAGVLFSGILLMFELFPASRRTIAGSLSQVFFASGMMVMLLLAYCIRNWRHFQLALGLIPAVTLSGYWLCPESIPWLVANDRTEEAVRVLNQAAKCNRISLDLSPLTDSRKKRSGSNDASSAIDDASNHDICQVLRHPISRKYVFIMFILWFVNSLVYFGLSFTTTMLTGNRYLNFFLNALIELPALLVCLFFLQRFGRRVPLCSFHVISGIVLIISVFVPRETGNGTNLEPLLVTLSMIGKTFITASFDTMYIYTPEIFPTNVRNFGMGTSNLAARVGAMLAPFSVNIARIIPWVPAVVFGSTSIFAGGLALYMPETLRTPLPQTLKEVIEWKQENPFLCCFSSYSVSSETTAILSKGTATQESEIVNPTYQSNSDITYDANS